MVYDRLRISRPVLSMLGLGNPSYGITRRDKLLERARYSVLF